MQGILDLLDPIIAEMIFLLVAAFGLMVRHYTRKALDAFEQKTGIEIEARHRETLHSAISTGLGLAARRLGVDLSTATPTERRTAIDIAIEHVRNRGAPEAAGKEGFRLSDPDLAGMIEAKMVPEPKRG